MTYILSWLVMFVGALLFVLKSWHFYDVWHDLRIAMNHENQASPPEVAQARGAMHLAWLRIVDGVLWLTLSSLVLWGGFHLPVTPISTQIRVVLLVMICFEIAKILSDRFTRSAVMYEIRRSHVDQTTLEKMEQRLETGINTGIEAAHAAYKEANNVNEKIANLSEQLLKKDKEEKPEGLVVESALSTDKDGNVIAVVKEKTK